MSYLIAINAKDLEIKDKDKCQKSGDKRTKGKDYHTVEAIIDKRVVTSKTDPWGKVGTVLYHVAWEGWPEDANTWETYENIEDDALITDYEQERQREAEEAEAAEAEALRDPPAEEVSEMEVETEVEAEAAPTPTPTVVEATAAVLMQEKEPVKILAHHYYRLKAGGLSCSTLFMNTEKS